jgi:hypothetical protein
MQTHVVEVEPALVAAPDAVRPRRPRRWLHDLIGVAWVILAAAAVMAPALAHGWSLGPIDQLSRFGLTKHAGTVVHNAQVSDLIREMIPWTTLAWNDVHHGFLPLWNPYTALGMPLAFNWQSSVFSVPSLVGYLVPLRLAFTVQVLVTLVVAGTGAYFLGRVMRLGVLGAAMAATVFELSGAFMALLGWPIASVMSWAGWLFAFTILVMRGRHSLRYITLLAVATAGAVYAGQPDTLVVLAAGLVVFVVVTLGIRARRTGIESVGRPLVSLAGAVVAGFGLAAPLILPSAELSRQAIRGVERHAAVPLSNLVDVISQKFNGLSLNGGISFDSTNIHGQPYVPTAAYVGVIGLALVVVAVGVRRHRPVVVGFSALVVLSACLVYLPPLVSLLNSLPLLGEIRWVRSNQVMDFGLAVLAGVGLDALARSHRRQTVRTWFGAGLGAVAVALALVWLFGRGHLPSAEASIRSRSFIWPALEVLIGAVVWGFLVVTDRWGRRHPTGDRWLLRHRSPMAAGALLISSTVLLVLIGTSWWPSSPTPVTADPQVATLQRTVGTAIVGFGSESCFFPPTLGVQAEANDIFGIHEMDAYDPLLPSELYTSWEISTKSGARPVGIYAYLVPTSAFCPVFTTATQARLFGVSYILQTHGRPAPVGTVFVRTVGTEQLYRVPGSSVATLTPLGRKGTLPPLQATGRPLTVTYPTPNSWKVTTRSASPQVLRLRLTDVAGWHATIDGRPLLVFRFDRAMLQARIPAGTHVVELRYLPSTFKAGIGIAVLTLIVLIGIHVVMWRRRRTAHPAVG